MESTNTHLDPTDHRKAEARKAMRERLAAMTPEVRHDASTAACARLASLEAFRHASVVMIYLPLPREVDTTALALRAFQRGKIVCAPRVDWHRCDMAAVEIQSIDDDEVEVDDRGVRTPRGRRLVLPGSIDLVVVPGLGFDAAGRRLGRGGGCYDRFLARLRPETVTVGLAFDAQIMDEVPTEPHDLRVHCVVTERRLVTGSSSRSTP